MKTKSTAFPTKESKKDAPRVFGSFDKNSKDAMDVGLCNLTAMELAFKAAFADKK